MVKTFRGASTLQNRAGRLFTQIDIFGEKVEFDIKGAGSVKSIFGAILTLGITCIIIAYGTNKFMVMQDREGTNHQKTTTLKGLDSTQVIE